VQPAVRELAIVIQPCGPARKNQCVTAMFWLHEGPALSAAADQLASIARDLGLGDDAVLAVVRNALARMTAQRA
jgi:hypothetical protein